MREDFNQFHAAAAAAAAVPVQQYPVISAELSGGKSHKMMKDTADADTQSVYLKLCEEHQIITSPSKTKCFFLMILRHKM